MIILILSYSIQFFFVFQKLYKNFCLDFMESGRGCSKGTIVRNYPANKITVGHDSMVFSPLCSGSDIFPLMTLTASEGNGADYIEWISQETPITIQTYLYHPSTNPTPPRQIPRYTPTIAHHQNKQKLIRKGEHWAKCLNSNKRGGVTQPPTDQMRWDFACEELLVVHLIFVKWIIIRKI